MSRNRPGGDSANNDGRQGAGFEKTILVYKGVQIRRDIKPYLEMAHHLRNSGHSIPPIDRSDSIETILQRFGGVYLTDGLESLRSLPDQSVVFSFSHAVFKHIPRKDAHDFVQELKRVSKPGKYSSHTFDLKDHSGGAIHHLIFSQNKWKSSAICNSGIYTNRLRFSEWMSILVREIQPTKSSERNTIHLFL